MGVWFSTETPELIKTKMKIRIENVQGLVRDAKLHDELNKSKQYDISLSNDGLKKKTRK